MKEFLRDIIIEVEDAHDNIIACEEAERCTCHFCNLSMAKSNLESVLESLEILKEKL